LPDDAEASMFLLFDRHPVTFLEQAGCDVDWSGSPITASRATATA
jgi:hypothetical protein